MKTEIDVIEAERSATPRKSGARVGDDRRCADGRQARTWCRSRPCKTSVWSLRGLPASRPGKASLAAGHPGHFGLLKPSNVLTEYLR
jgi:hypothetical protein